MSPLVETVLTVVSFTILIFFILYGVATFSLIGLSLMEAALVKVERGELFTPPERLRRPGISLIAPAYNTEPLIVANARSLLEADYEPLEVVIVDDGSEDGTTAALEKAYDLIELPVGDRVPIPTELVTRLMVSRSDPRLRVVVKENGGRSDAVNAGLNIAHHDLVGVVDADTLLEADALKRIGEVFAAAPDDVVGTGGTIRIANGAVIEKGRIAIPRVPLAGVEATQIGEYMRGFLGGRIAWSRINGLLIISGAFGVFRRDLMLHSGGYSKETLGEDMELAMRFHHHLRPSHPATRIAYAPDANAWTEIPTTMKALRGQRIRWHVGLLDNLRMHRKMFLRRRFGAAGLLALPYTALFEVIGPVLQVAGYAILVVLVIFGHTSWLYVVGFIALTVLVSQLQTAGAIAIEELAFRRYRNRDLMMLAGWSLLEIFWYRPQTAVWRTWATVLVIFGRRPGWGTIPRGAAFGAEAETELHSAPLSR